MFCHQDSEVNNVFLCRSSFKKFEPEPEIGINADPTPAEYKKKDEIEYLPGERLLIKLNKQRRKAKDKQKKAKDKQKKYRENNIDVERVSASLARVLNSF